MNQNGFRSLWNLALKLDFVGLSPIVVPLSSALVGSSILSSAIMHQVAVHKNYFHSQSQVVTAQAESPIGFEALNANTLWHKMEESTRTIWSSRNPCCILSRLIFSK